MLHGLRLERTNDAEAHSAAGPASELQKDEEAQGSAAFDGECASDRSEHGSKMAGEGIAQNGLAQFSDNRMGEAAFGGREPCLALGSTGAIGNVIGRESVEEPIDFQERNQSVERSANEWERAVGGLVQSGVQKAFEIGGGFDLTGLGDGFETSGMREPAGRKRGVGELPQQPWRSCAQQ